MVTDKTLKSGKCEYCLTVLSIIAQTEILLGNIVAVYRFCVVYVYVYVYVYSSFGWGGCSLLQYIKV